MVDVVVVDMGGVVDLLWGRWRWSTTVSWAGWCTHWGGAAVSTRDGASLFCWSKNRTLSKRKTRLLVEGNRLSHIQISVIIVHCFAQRKQAWSILKSKAFIAISLIIVDT